MNEEQAEAIAELKRRLIKEQAEQQRPEAQHQWWDEIRADWRLADELNLARDAAQEANWQMNEAALSKSLAEFYHRHEGIKEQLRQKEERLLAGDSVSPQHGGFAEGGDFLCPRPERYALRHKSSGQFMKGEVTRIGAWGSDLRAPSDSGIALTKSCTMSAGRRSK